MKGNIGDTETGMEGQLVVYIASVSPTTAQDLDDHRLRENVADRGRSYQGPIRRRGRGFEGDFPHVR